MYIEQLELPAPLLALAKNVEEGASVRIEVVRMNAPLHPGAYSRCPAATRINRGPTPQLLLWTDHPAEDALAHELLHMRRYLLDGVPQLQFTRKLGGLPAEECCSGSGELENDLEHYLAVFPGLISMGYGISIIDFARRWRAEEKVPRDLRDRIPARWFTLLFYATTQRFCEEAATKAHAEQVMEDAGMLREARAFSSRLSRVIRDKKAVVKSIAHDFGIPHDMIALRYHDGPGKLIRDVDLAGRELNVWR